MPVSPIPAGHHTVTPYLVVENAATLIEFTQQAFDGQVVERLDGPNDVVMHAEVKVGDSIIMMGTANPHHPALPAMIHLYVPDADATFKKAVAAGATVVMELADMFYGDRSGGVRDTNGIQWWIATHIEDVSREEIGRRAAALGK